MLEIIEFGFGDEAEVVVTAFLLNGQTFEVDPSAGVFWNMDLPGEYLTIDQANLLIDQMRGEPSVHM